MIFELCDRNWDRISITKNVIADSESIKQILGSAEGDGEVSIPIDDHIVAYLPDPDVSDPVDYRFKLYDTAVTPSANLIVNGSMGDETGDASGWTVGNGWDMPFAGVSAFHGALVARAVTSTSSLSPLKFPTKIDIDRTLDWNISAYYWMRSITPGSIGWIELKQYSSADTYLASEFIPVTSPSVNWNRAIFWMGPTRTANRRPFHASAAKINLEFWAGSTTFVWDVDAVQVEQGKTATTFRTKELESSELIFAGLIDTIRKEGDTVTVAGKQRGVELSGNLIGARDFLGWDMPRLLNEFTRDNIARAPFATVHASASKTATPVIAAITGETKKGQYWSLPYDGPRPETFVLPAWIVVDLGGPKEIEAVRVVADWWSGNYYLFKIWTSIDGITWENKIDSGNHYLYGQHGYSEQGVLVEFPPEGIRYIKVEVYKSTDGYPRIAGIFAYTRVSNIGESTDYTVPWIENDNSGNITYTNSTRVIQDGAFLGDNTLDNSLVTRLNNTGVGVNGVATHTFRGTADAVYFTQTSRGTFQAIVDGDIIDEDITIPSNSYQFKGFEISGLENKQHTLQIVNQTGVVQIDYFSGLYQSSYRRAEEDHSMWSFNGAWQRNFDIQLSGGALMTNRLNGWATFEFFGDSIKVFCKKNNVRGMFDMYVDGVLYGRFDLYSATPIEQALIASWTGTYGRHLLWIANANFKNPASSNFWIDIDRVEGNWAHQVYLRSDQATNLQMIQSLAENTNTFLRLGYDGALDLLGAVGDDTGQIIRDGENEGGNIISSEIEGDWSNTASAILALGQGTEKNTLRVLVKDQGAINRIGIKIAKMESRDVPDAYMLVRLAWQALQEAKIPKRQYSFEYDPVNLGPIEIGDTVRIWSPRLKLNGDVYRVFEKELTGSGSPVTIRVANKRDRLSDLMSRTSRDLSVQTNTAQGHVSVTQYGGASDNIAAESGGSTHRSTELWFYIDDSASVMDAKLRLRVSKYRAYVATPTAGGPVIAGHTHPVTFDITEQPVTGGVTTLLDGVNINNLLDGPLAEGEHDAELTNVLQTSGWHTLRIGVSLGKARVTPYLIVKTLHF